VTSGTEELEDLFENAPCGYLTLASDGRISRVNQTLCHWTGYSREHFAGKRMHQFLNMAGRIYFETHIAPLLRMQGFFNEFALDFVTESGDRMPVIANAAERRSPDGELLSTRLVLLSAADRRRYERELVDARAIATRIWRASARPQNFANSSSRFWERPPQSAGCYQCGS
jgi:sigma-B regulation protein RsbU (phosphoserine phosphatase)